MTQNGHYEGWISSDGDRRELAGGTVGTRDRSWGVRPIGARDPQPMPGAPMPGFFWQWTPINFADGSLFFHVNNDEQRLEHACGLDSTTRRPTTFAKATAACGPGSRPALAGRPAERCRWMRRAPGR